MSSCLECHNEIKVWGCVQLCDRCLDARLYNELQDDDYVLVRRSPSGVWLTDNVGGRRHSTNITALRLDLRRELAGRMDAWEAELSGLEDTHPRKGTG